MNEVQLKDKRFEIFLSEDTILKAISKLSVQVNEDLKDKQPLFVIVLNGAFMFASDLIGKFEHLCEITFIRLKSYQGINQDNNMKVIHGLVEDIKDRDVVIVEDIIDTGHTISHLLSLL